MSVDLSGDPTLPAGLPDDKATTTPSRGTKRKLGADTSERFDAESLGQLRDRLFVAAAILAAGFVAFLIRALALPPGVDVSMMTRPMVFEAFVATTVVMVVLAAVVYSPLKLTAAALYGLEFLVFAVPGTFFSFEQMQHICECSETAAAGLAQAYPSSTVIPWLILMQLYGVMIPSGTRRAGFVIAAMTVTPVITAMVAGQKSRVVWDVLYAEYGLSLMILTLLLSAAIALYGVTRLRRVRREAFEAKSLGSYNLVRKLGKGGMGEVYLAEHRLLKRPCAVKIVRADYAASPTAVERFESEVRSTARLSHPNTVEVYDYGRTDEGTFYYAMEYLPGASLQDLLAEEKRLPPSRVVYLLAQVCGALQEAHDRGLIHRDVKPGNIYAAERGGLYDVAKLLDFGLVKHRDIGEDPGMTQAGSMLGSPLYAAPEMVVGEKVGPESDIYSLGATAYYLLAGRPVFPEQNAVKAAFAHIKETPRPLHEVADVPRDLSDVVMRCLEKEPSDRYSSALELRSALLACDDAYDWNLEAAKRWWTVTRPAKGERELDPQDSALIQDSAATVEATVLTPVTVSG